MPTLHLKKFSTSHFFSIWNFLISTCTSSLYTFNNIYLYYNKVQMRLPTVKIHTQFSKPLLVLKGLKLSWPHPHQNFQVTQLSPQLKSSKEKCMNLRSKLRLKTGYRLEESWWRRGQTRPIRILPSESSCPALIWDFLMADLSFLLFFCSISLPCCSMEVSLLEAGGVTSPADWATSLKVWLVSSKDVCRWSDEFLWSKSMVDGWDE